MLQQINGNPEIKLWNGFVGDWQDIDNKFVELDVFNRSFKSYVNMARMSGFAYRKEARELSDEDVKNLRKGWNRKNYEVNRFVTKEDVSSGDYKKKTFTIIQAKIKGVSTFDRLGDINY